MKKLIPGMLAVVLLLIFSACQTTNPVTTENPETDAVMTEALETTERVDAGNVETTASVSEDPADPEPSEVETAGATVSEPSTPSETTKPTESASTTPHTHSYTKSVTAPTCTNKGYTTYKCSCGDSYKDDYIDAVGHDYQTSKVAATCTAGGYTQYKCSRCGNSQQENKTSALGHNYTVTTVAATTSAEGYDLHTCSRCGDEYKDNYTEKLKVVYDINAAMAAGNSYAQSLGFTIDYSLDLSNSGFYPGEWIGGDEISNRGGQTYLNQLAIGAVQYTYNRLVYLYGPLNGELCRCYIEYDSTNDNYTIRALYG